MNFTIAKEDLIRPLRLVSGITSTGVAVNDVFANIHMEIADSKLNICGGDGTTEARSAIVLAGDHTNTATMLKGKGLLDFINTLPDKSGSDPAQINFTAESQHVNVESGGRSIKLNTARGDYPKLDLKEDSDTPVINLEVPAAPLLRLVNKTSLLISREAGHRPALQGMLLELREGQLRGVATDAQCLALCDISVPNCKPAETNQYIIPTLALDGIKKLLADTGPDIMAQLNLSPRAMTLVVGPDRISSRLIDAQFPDYMRVLSQEFDKKLLLNKETLDGAMNRANVIFGADHVGLSGCTFSVKDQTLNLYSKNSNGEEVVEDITIQEKEGEDISLMLNTTFVKRGIGIFEENELRFFIKGPKEGVQIMSASGNNDVLYMMMPMNIG